MVRIRLGLIAALLAVWGVAGCQQRVFMNESDWKHYRHLALNVPPQAPIPSELEPLIDVTQVSTVLSPEGKKRYISLAECIAIALENGRTGEFLDRVSGYPTAAPPSNFTDRLGVFAYDPAIAATEIERSLSKFDARWETSMVWGKVDRPVGTALETFQAGFTGRESIEQDTAQFRTDLIKPLPTGGLAGITFRTDYEFSNLNPRVNPAYRPALEFSIEQPLLQGSGVAINQLRDAHPGSLRGLLPQGPFGVRGILLTRIDYDNRQAEFERRVHELLFVVEQAYWELYCAYWDLYSREMAMRQLHRTWQQIKTLYEAGARGGDPFEFARIEAQFQSFRAQRLQVLGTGAFGRRGVLEAERRLRYLLGLPADDGVRLIPLDTPTVAPFTPDWHAAVTEAMLNRPELVQVRQEIQAAQLDLLAQKDFLLPDVRVFATYDINALGSHLDGSDESSALRNLAENRFNNWQAGVRAEIPIGFRDAHARVRRAQLGIAQRVLFLRDQEQRVAFELTQAYRQIIQLYEEIRIQRARRLAATRELELLYQKVAAGTETPGSINFLQAIQDWADAVRDEQFAICDYNVALVDFERRKGTIMRHDNVTIVDGPLPACAVARASEHIAARDRSEKLGLVLAAPGDCLACNGGADPHTCVSQPGVVLPSLSTNEAVPVPVLIQQVQTQPQLPEQLVPADAKAAPAAPAKDHPRPPQPTAARPSTEPPPRPSAGITPPQ